MALPSDRLLLTPAEAARRIALRQLEDAAAALQRLSDPADTQALHDFRVATRRLRSTLRAWRTQLRGSVRKKQRRALARIQDATSASRDAQVGLLWLQQQAGDLRPAQRSGWAWISARLESQRAAAAEGALAQARASFEKLHAPLSAGLARLRVAVDLRDCAAPPCFGPVVAARLRKQRDLLSDHLQAIRTLEDSAEAHAARIQLKHLRYLIDSTAQGLAATSALLERCKQLQNLLGDLNDAHVMQAQLLQALEDTQRAPAAASLRRPSAAAFERRRRPREQAGLLELSQRARARCETLFEQLRTQWLADGAAALSEQVELCAQQAADAARTAQEIERKFLLRARPRLPAGTATLVIDQGWLPGERLRERLRRTSTPAGERYTRTLKFGQGLRRTEIEEPTSERIFAALWPLTEGRRVSKLRHAVAAGERVWEIDEFLDRELWLAEVELPDVDALAEIPEWLAPWIVREVTDEAGFTNFELAR